MQTDLDKISVIKIIQRPSSHCVEPKGGIKKLTGSLKGSCIYQLPLPKSHLQLNSKYSTCNEKEGIILWDN